MEFKTDSDHTIPILMGIILIIVDIIFLRNSIWFYALLIAAVILMMVQYLIDYFTKIQDITKLESKFPAFVNDLVARLEIAYPEAEIEMYNGKQPLYYYIISAE